MRDRWQALARELRVGCRLEPAHAGDREIVISRREGAAFPSGGTRPAGCVAKHGHRVVPGNRLSVPDERRLPVFPLLIAALVDELFELPVGHFVPVDEVGVVRRFDRRDADRPPERIGARHQDHAVGNLALRRQPQAHHRPPRGGRPGRLGETWFDRFPQEVATRQRHILDRRGAHVAPGLLLGAQFADVDLGALRIGLYQRLGACFRPGLLKVRDRPG